MGFHFRKSFNLGGGFRINLSRSGIGYSWGTKGFRISNSPRRSRRRKLFSSHGGSRAKANTRNNQANQAVAQAASNYYGTEYIVNNASTMVSEGLEDLLAAAKKSILVNRIANIGMVVSLIYAYTYPIVLLLACAFIALKIYVRTKGVIDLDYTIENDQQGVVAQYIQPMMYITQSNKVWRIVQSSKVLNTKISSGAENSVVREGCRATQTLPFPFRANVAAATFKSKRETLVFLPDKLFVIQGIKVGALSYHDISTSMYTTRFHEDGSLPLDANVIGQTWQYVNKSGSPDKRYANNRQLPVCLYGQIEMKASSGLNTVIMFSNASFLTNPITTARGPAMQSNTDFNR